MSASQTQQSPRPSSPSRDADSARTEPTRQASSGGSQDDSNLDQDGYPPQRHAGVVGYGPNYNRGATMGDKLTGVKEEIRGHVTRNPEVAARGHDRRTGELKRREHEQEDTRISSETPEEKVQPATQTRSTTDPIDDEGARAATVAPGGTDTQAPGMKIMDEQAH
ncbi:hypothetical protein BC834DRAFT_125913 [Gloeopeniophorella convolvens]|nr:hypothetical protein BC834DRAFT_125913 [Gloeopeniophorella convolvens]